MNDQADAWTKRVLSRVLAGILLMFSGFLFFLGTYGKLHDTLRPDDLINKGVLGAPLMFYCAMCLIFARQDSEDSSDSDISSDYRESQLDWYLEHWVLVLGAIAFEIFVVSCWVSYLHHHGHPVVDVMGHNF